MLVPLLLVPLFKLLASFEGQGFGHVVVDGRDEAHILLVFGDVELVGKVTLSEFGEPKGLRKGREGHLEEADAIDQTNAIMFDF